MDSNEPAGVGDHPDEWPGRVIYPEDMLQPSLEDLVTQPVPGMLRDAAMDEITALNARARLVVADQYRAIAQVLRDGAADPSPWAGPDPILDPGWVDPRGRTVAAVRRERADIAVRAAAADIAVRLRMSEATIRSRARDVETLRQRCPQLWASFLGAAVCEANARTAAAIAASLPDDAHDAWSQFDERVTSSATRLTPAKFRLRARFVREKVHAESIEARHVRAARDRGVWIEAEFDGMATLTAVMPAIDAHSTMGRLDAHARHLQAQAGETRTLAQLRSDSLRDLAATTATGAAVGTARPAVAITIPVLTLLGADSSPAQLDGYGPIDLDTAKRLAGEATSWVRMLTHPVTGTVLDVDRTTYRIPAALRRWLGVQHPTCIFPGCNRLARECDLDHRLDWRYGGSTADTNLAPECRHHHRVKHGSDWLLDRDGSTGQLFWVSPSGVITDVDPPPF